jgi:hypothetical protein
MSYWPGVGEAQCGTANRELEATDVKQTITAASLTLANRNSDYYESCYYEIKPAANTYKDGSYIMIFVDSIVNANVYIYEGTHRRNVTTFIEGDSTAAKGAPYKIPVH